MDIEMKKSISKAYYITEMVMTVKREVIAINKQRNKQTINKTKHNILFE